MYQTFSFSHSVHRGVDEARWRITELDGSAFRVEAWPDDDNRPELVQSITLRRFATEIVIDHPEAKGGGLTGAGFSMLNRLQLYRQKLMAAGVPEESIPPFVVNSADVEALLRMIHASLPDDERDERVQAVLDEGFGSFFGARVAWSARLDRYVEPSNG